MPKKKIREPKSAHIHIRTNLSQKEKIERDAKSVDMNVSQYLTHLANHKNVIILDHGKELIKEIYQLNQKLNKYEKYSRIPVDEIRDAISLSVIQINNIRKGLN